MTMYAQRMWHSMHVLVTLDACDRMCHSIHVIACVTRSMCYRCLDARSLSCVTAYMWVPVGGGIFEGKGDWKEDRLSCCLGG